MPVLCFLLGGGVAGTLLACLVNTEDQCGVEGGVALGHDGGGADPAELGIAAAVEGGRIECSNFKIRQLSFTQRKK